MLAAGARPVGVEAASDAAAARSRRGASRTSPYNAAGAPVPPRYDRRMAVTTTPKLDAARLRADFPVFEQPIHGKQLAYLDSANSSQKPRQVLDAMHEFYAHSYANVHRAVYELAERSTAGFEGAREKV